MHLAKNQAADGAGDWVDLPAGRYVLAAEVPSGEAHTVTFHTRLQADGVALSVTESGAALELSETVPTKQYIHPGGALRSTVANYDTNPISVQALRADA